MCAFKHNACFALFEQSISTICASCLLSDLRNIRIESVRSVCRDWAFCPGLHSACSVHFSAEKIYIDIDIDIDIYGSSASQYQSDIDIHGSSTRVSSVCSEPWLSPGPVEPTCSEHPPTLRTLHTLYTFHTLHTLQLCNFAHIVHFVDFAHFAHWRLHNVQCILLTAYFNLHNVQCNGRLQVWLFLTQLAFEHSLAQWTE